MALQVFRGYQRSFPENIVKTFMDGNRISAKHCQRSVFPSREKAIVFFICHSSSHLSAIPYSLFLASQQSKSTAITNLRFQRKKKSFDLMKKNFFLYCISKLVDYEDGNDSLISAKYYIAKNSYKQTLFSAIKENYSYSVVHVSSFIICLHFRGHSMEAHLTLSKLVCLFVYL